MKTYYIIGSGGFAKEVYFLASQTLDESENTFGGFIDYNSNQEFITARGKTCKIHDEEKFLNNIKPSSSISLYIGIGNPKIISNVSEKFKGYNFPNLYSNDLRWDKESIDLGIGNIFTNGVILTVDIKIGSFNIFNLNTTVGHDVVIGDGNVFNPACNISGEIKIGSFNLFGVSSTVLQQIEFGSNSILGANALLTKNGENNGLYVGAPAKRIKDL